MDKKQRKKRIAVISPNQEIAMFFELEAMACGCSVQVFSAPPQEILAFDFVVLDVSAGYCFAQNSDCQVACVCASGQKVEQEWFDYLWEWPVSVKTVREAYEGAVAAGVTTEKASLDTATIYFLPNVEDAVIYRNQTVSLTRSEWFILNLLAQNSEKMVSRASVAALFEPSKGNLIEVHICHLRKKLEAPFGIRLIETVRGKGYVLKAKSVYL